METYTGQHAATLRLMDFLRVALAERVQMLRFFRWAGVLRRLAQVQREDL